MAKKDTNDIGKEQRTEAPKVSDATDGGDSRLTAGYKDNPDKPDPTSVAQVEVLKDEESDK